MKFAVNTEDLRLIGDRHQVNLLVALDELLYEIDPHVPDIYLIRELFRNVYDIDKISTDVEKAKAIYCAAFEKWDGEDLVLDPDKYYPQVMLLASIITSRDYEYSTLKQNLFDGLDIESVVVSLFSSEILILSVEDTE